MKKTTHFISAQYKKLWPEKGKSNPVYGDAGIVPALPTTLLPKRPHQNVGIIFDWFVFQLSTLLSFLFHSTTFYAASRQMPFIVLFMVACYAAGVSLKRLPFSLRFAKVKTKNKINQLPFFQLLFHCIAFWVLLYVILLQIGEAGAVSWLSPKNQMPSFFIGLFAGVTLTVMVIKLRSLPRRVTHPQIRITGKKKALTVETVRYTEKRLQWQELAADLLLVLAVSFFTAYLWNPLVHLFIATSNIRTNTGTIEFVLIITLLYVCVYLPFRVVYLIEDGGYSKKQWLSFLFMLLMIMIRSIIYAHFNDW